MTRILPVRGTSIEINDTPIVNGQILFETDSDTQNRVYMDIEVESNNSIIPKRIEMGIYDWNHIDNKPFNSIGTGLNVTNGVLNLDSPIVVTWSDITNKPFNIIGDGLYVSNDELKAVVEDIDFDWDGTASSSTSTCQKLVYTNEGTTYIKEINGTKYMEDTQTLSTSTNNVYTFSSSDISSTSVFSVYTSIFGLRPTDITVNGNSCAITFPSYPYENTSMTCRLYIK